MVNRLNIRFFNDIHWMDVCRFIFRIIVLMIRCALSLAGFVLRIFCAMLEGATKVLMDIMLLNFFGFF